MYHSAEHVTAEAVGTKSELGGWGFEGLECLDAVGGLFFLGLPPELRGKMLLAITGVVFVVLVAFSVPIVFALGAAAVTGLLLGGYSLEMLATSLAPKGWLD